MRRILCLATTTVKQYFNNSFTGSALLIGELWELLWVAARSKEHRARLCSIEWACDLFPFSNAVARHLCASLSDDGVTAVRTAARRGLQPPAAAATTAATTDNSDAAAMFVDSSSEAVQTRSQQQQQQQQQQLLPAFADFVHCALQSQSHSGHGPITVSELSPAALAHTLEFALSTLQLDSTASAATAAVVQPEPAALSVFVARLEAALAAVSSAVDPLQGHASTQQLHRSAALCLKQLLLQQQPAQQCEWSQQLCRAYTDRGQWLQHWLAHESSTDIRESFAEVVGCVALYMAPDSQAVPLLRGLTLRARAAVVPVGTSSAVQMSNRTVAAAHGAACAVGAALSSLAAAAGGTTAAAAWSTLQSDVVPRAMSAVTALVGHPVTLLHTSACTAVGRVGAVTALPLPLAATSSATTDATTADTVVTLQAAFERLWSVCKIDGVIQDAGKRAETAVEAAGNACKGVSLTTTSVSLELSSQQRVTTLDKLFALASTQKEDELHFAVGCAAAAIAATGPLRITTAAASTLATAAAAHASKHVALPQASTSEADVTDTDYVTVDALEHVLQRVLLVLLEDHSPHIVNAGCVYLLCLVSELQGHALLDGYLPAVQAAFLSRLTVKNELAQEVCTTAREIVTAVQYR
jgi:hypothetical protein